MHQMVAAALVFLLTEWAFLPQYRPNEGQWLCRTYSGKGDGTIVIRQAHSLQWFTEHLPLFDSEVAWRVKHESGWKDLRAEIKRVGKLAGHEVADVVFRIPTARPPIGKLVLIGDSGHFRPVVWTLADTEVLFAPSKITIVSNTPVLVSRNEVSGTGNFYFEDYFVFDDPSGLPLNLRFDSAIAEELTRILPAGRGVRKGGGFDIESLHYTQRVWTDGDANCCPSAGKVDIQFAILGNAAVVIKATYDPAYKWPS